MNINTLSNKPEDYKAAKLAIALYPSAIGKKNNEKNSYHARPIFRSTLEMGNIADDILATGVIKGYSKEQILSLWNVINSAVLDRVINGAIVHGGIGTYCAKINGSFDNNQSDFNPAKNSIDIAFRIENKVKKLFSTIRPVIAQGNRITPEINFVHDIESNTNDTLTPGGFVKITGSFIRISGDNKDNGLYFVNIEDESKTVKVESSKIGVNTSSEIACTVPALENGKYKLKIVTQFTRSSIPCKETKSKTFSRIFTVI